MQIFEEENQNFYDCYLCYKVGLKTEIIFGKGIKYEFTTWRRNNSESYTRHTLKSNFAKTFQNKAKYTIASIGLELSLRSCYHQQTAIDCAAILWAIKESGSSDIFIHFINFHTRGSTEWR